MEESNLSDGENVKRFKTENGVIEKSGEECTQETNNEECKPSTSNNDSDYLILNSLLTSDKEENDDDDSSNNDNESEVIEIQTSPTYSIRSMSPSVSADSDPEVIADSDADVIPSSDPDEDNCVKNVLKKPKPKHKWFIVPEINNRQLGCSSKKQSSELFQQRCYGSLHCVQRLELMYKLEKHEGCVNSLNFHPNGDLLASASDDLKVVLWDWKNGRSLLSYYTKHRGNVFQSKFLPLTGDLHIATCSRDGQVRLAQVSAQEGLRSLRKLGSHRGSCNKLSVLFDQPQIILSAGEDALVLRHDLRCSQPSKVVTVKGQLYMDVALYSIDSHPLNTHEFCVAGRDYMVRTFDLRTGHQLQSYHAFKSSNCYYYHHITSAVYNHNGSEILASYNDEDIYLFDINDTCGNYIHHYRGHRNYSTVKGVNFFGPKSEYIVSGSDCGNIYFWDRESEAIVQWLLADDRGVVNCLEPHPQLPFLCTSGLDWDVKVWVPSYEQDPQMKGLAEVVHDNMTQRSGRSSLFVPDIEHMWVIWRELRGSSDLGTVFHFNNPNHVSWENDIISSSTEVESDDDDEDDSDGPYGCTTS